MKFFLLLAGWLVAVHSLVSGCVGQSTTGGDDDIDQVDLSKTQSIELLDVYVTWTNVDQVLGGGDDGSMPISGNFTTFTLTSPLDGINLFYSWLAVGLNNQQDMVCRTCLLKM